MEGDGGGWKVVGEGVGAGLQSLHPVTQWRLNQDLAL